MLRYPSKWINWWTVRGPRLRETLGFHEPRFSRQLLLLYSWSPVSGNSMTITMLQQFNLWLVRCTSSLWCKWISISYRLSSYSKEKSQFMWESVTVECMTFGFTQWQNGSQKSLSCLSYRSSLTSASIFQSDSRTVFTSSSSFILFLQWCFRQQQLLDISCLQSLTKRPLLLHVCLCSTFQWRLQLGIL